MYLFVILQQNPLSRLEKYLYPRLVIETAMRLIDTNSPHRLLPSWRGWKKGDQVSIDLVELGLELANQRTDMNIVELKTLFTFCVKLNYYHNSREENSSERPAFGIHSLSNKLSSLSSTSWNREEYWEGVEQIMQTTLPGKLNHLIETVANGDYIYAYADAILELVSKLR